MDREDPDGLRPILWFVPIFLAVIVVLYLVLTPLTSVPHKQAIELIKAANEGLASFLWVLVGGPSIVAAVKAFMKK